MGVSRHFHIWCTDTHTSNKHNWLLVCLLHPAATTLSRLLAPYTTNCWLLTMWLQFLFHHLSATLCHVLPSHSESTWTRNLCWGRPRCGCSRRKLCRPLGGRGGPQRARVHNANIPSRVCDRSGVESMTLHDKGCTACPFYPCTAATRPNLVDTWSTVAFCGYAATEDGPIHPVRETKNRASPLRVSISVLFLYIC